MKSAGIPGLGGSLGTCCVCGKSFAAEVILGRSVHSVAVGGCRMAVHDKDCFDKLVSLASDDGGIAFSKWRELPAGSPLIAEMQRLENEAATETEARDDA